MLEDLPRARRQPCSGMSNGSLAIAVGCQRAPASIVCFSIPERRLAAASANSANVRARTTWDKAIQFRRVPCQQSGSMKGGTQQPVAGRPSNVHFDSSHAKYTVFCDF